MNRQLLRMTTLLQLEQRARRAETAEELGFAIVNETHALVAYAQAALWQPGPLRGRIAAISGLAVPDRDGPFAAWLTGLAARLAGQPAGRDIRVVTAADVDAETARDWTDHLPAQLLWVPLPGPGGELLGVLLLSRPEAWSSFDQHIFTYLGEAYGHALDRFRHKRRSIWPARRTRLVWLGAAAALALLMVMPVRQSVLAPAEVTPSDPTLVRSPFEGVVERVVVQPNAQVRKGDLLLVLDQTRLRSRVEIARRARDVAEAEYRSAVQQAVYDPEVKASLVALQGRLEQQVAELSYLEDLLGRTEIRAAHDGIAVFDDANEWLGRPVAVGERIMLLADPAAVRLDIHLPVGDAIGFEPGAEVLFFLNTAPERPVDAVLDSVAFRATARPDGTLAYRMKAVFASAEARPRIGLKGTAKVYGDRVPLARFLFRRPFATVRQWLAL
ncbi:efflux RND transporter periplasmic adaptor subunit [Indioceanicola profundi]|uniref:efflux RND transporter periplasmic adaptor subunit n=1 Tax=Indioceanicola profundi TaxID=2220096 RepID=UPI0013C49459|nr:HlyD family efflux transporter periplasmic adaptor subunit [Indioceanicola profundi]